MEIFLDVIAIYTLIRTIYSLLRKMSAQKWRTCLCRLYIFIYIYFQFYWNHIENKLWQLDRGGESQV